MDNKQLTYLLRGKLQFLSERETTRISEQLQAADELAETCRAALEDRSGMLSLGDIRIALERYLKASKGGGE